MRSETEGNHVLYEELKEKDPVSAERINPGDSYRIIRALEVFKSSGKPLSEYAVPDEIRKDLDLLIIGLQRPREELFERINLRVDIMFRQGLFDEFRELTARGYVKDDPGMRGIGYGEFFRMINEPCMSLEDVRELIKKNSRRYAKRQMTFFRSIPGIKWLNPDEDRKEISVLVKDFMDRDSEGQDP